MSGDGRVSEFHWDGVCQPASEAIEEVVFGCLRHGIKLPSTVGLSPRAFRAVYFCVRNDPRWFLRHPDGKWTEEICPLVKGPRTDNPRTNGCPPLPDRPPPPPPPLPDRDQDGVPDVEDACPDHPGARHPDPTRNGCPDILITPTTMTVFDKILFKTGSAEILPQSNPILDKVATALNEHPELVLVEVAGHADERGAEKLNLDLTQARVNSVMVALVARNVERSRLRARGYGYYCPRAEGHDEEAWGKNRRVEFVILKTKEGPTGAPMGCDVATAHGVAPAPVP